MRAVGRNRTDLSTAARLGRLQLGAQRPVVPSGRLAMEIMDRLSATMQSALLSNYVQAVVDHTSGTTELTLTGTDDEDGSRYEGVGSFVVPPLGSSSF